MNTEAQIETERTSATGSTGPITPEGKSTSSRNAVTHGLFTAANLIHPHENDEFTELADGLRRDLAPAGTLEELLATEVVRAAWRLRRCAQVEDALEDGSSSQPVDRARQEAHRILKRSMDELRRLQNERRFRIEVLPEGFKIDDLGLTSYKDLMPAMAAEKRWQLLKNQTEEISRFGSDKSFEKMLAETVGPVRQPQNAPRTKRTLSAPETPRNGPCPCGSGQKHKRCCGQNAPPVLHSAAA